ncbi:MAG: hypothetical protein J7484_01735 [Microbacterium sp.]|nr:hypothetical protein [Microbacterium sp.]
MADDGIWVKYDELSRMNDQLKAIVEELEQAASRTDAVQDAIGIPYGKARLRQRVHDFEGRWDDKRKDLKSEIDKVQKHVQGVLDGLKDWDQKTASKMEIDVTGAKSPRNA